MIGIYRIPYLLLLVIVAMMLCGCPPLDHKIFVRNTTADTATLTFLYASPFDTISDREISVRAQNELVAVNNKTLALLKENMTAYVDSGKVFLTIPPGYTVFISDIVNSFYMFANKTLIVRHADKADTMMINYPYKKGDVKNLKRKRDHSYNYFYRTIVYFDIR